MRFIFLIFVFGLLFANPVLAQGAGADPSVCGTPEAANLETTPGENFCNIYQRQMAYRTEAQAFRTKILERQKNFNAPRAAAYTVYKSEMDTLNEGRGGDSSKKLEYKLNE